MEFEGGLEWVNMAEGVGKVDIMVAIVVVKQSADIQVGESDVNTCTRIRHYANREGVTYNHL